MKAPTAARCQRNTLFHGKALTHGIHRGNRNHRIDQFQPPDNQWEYEKLSRQSLYEMTIIQQYPHTRFAPSRPDRRLLVWIRDKTHLPPTE